MLVFIEVIEFVLDVILVSNPVILIVFAFTELVKIVILEVAEFKLVVKLVILLVFDNILVSKLLIVFELTPPTELIVATPVTFAVPSKALLV